MDIEKMCRTAKEASRRLAVTCAELKNEALLLAAQIIEEKAGEIESANKKDLKNAVERDMAPAMVDRLTLTPKRISSMAEGLRTIAGLPDPCGQLISSRKMPNGLVIKKVRVPIGVVLVIYESRPNVTADSAGLCFKSGNAVILRGGSEAVNSNKAIAGIFNEALEKKGVERGCIQFVDDTDRAVVSGLLKKAEYIDLVIPRGGEGLIRAVAEQSHIPVIKHYKGVCHIYVDKDADLSMAERIIVNAKTSRPGVCNAAETLLVHRDIADRFLPRAADALRRHNVELRGCEKTRRIISGALPAEEKDWETEYLALVLSVKVVNSVEEAVSHINRYGSMHSDAIVTENKKNAESFEREVDSACVFVNASTRFSDGGQFGMGAEIGISTDKIHARGPVGAEELTSYKYIIEGAGQVRE